MTAGQHAFRTQHVVPKRVGASGPGSAVKGVNSFDPRYQGRRDIKFARGSVATTDGVVWREGEGKQHAAAPTIDRAVVLINGEDVRWAQRGRSTGGLGRDKHRFGRVGLKQAHSLRQAFGAKQYAVKGYDNIAPCRLVSVLD